MKKIKYKIIFGVNVIIMMVILGALLFNNISFNVKASSEVNITFQTNTEEGEESFSYSVEDEEVTLKGGSVPKGTKITLTATPKEGYRFKYWIYDLKGVTKKLSTNETVSVTVKQDYSFKAVYVSNGKIIVTFHDVNKNILDYQIINKGENVTKVEIPPQKGYSIVGWNESLKNINTDLDLEPVYNATVWSVFRDYAGDFFKGLGITLGFSVISVFLALFLGAVICLAKISSFKPLSFLATSYIEIIRGVPLLLQLLLIYAIMPRIEIGKFLNTEILAAILALFLNSGAYVAEIFRSGIQAVDKGQMEAGRALGLTKWMTMKKIIIPQAIKNVLPSIGNELIMVIKETSLASTVDAGIGELMSVKKQITASSFINIPPFIVIAIMYFVVTFSLSKVVRYIERRLEARD